MGNIKSAYNNNQLQVSTSTWNDEFDLLDRSYPISDIQDYSEYIIKKHETVTDNSPTQIYHNKIKVNYELELLSPETMELLGSTKKDVDRVKDGEDVPKLESVEVVLVHCNLVNKNYQQLSKVLFTFVPAKKFRQLINISPHSLTTLKRTNTEFSSIEARITDQNSKPIEIEDNVDLDTNNWVDIIKIRYSTEPKYRKYVESHRFLSFARKCWDKYGKELIDTATKTGIDAAKTASERVVQKGRGYRTFNWK